MGLCVTYSQHQRVHHGTRAPFWDISEELCVGNTPTEQRAEQCPWMLILYERSGQIYTDSWLVVNDLADKTCMECG